MISDKFKVARLKPLAPKDKKPAAAAIKERHPKVVPPALKIATPKEKRTSAKGGRKVERKVEFEDDPLRYCVNDMARHYKIVTTLGPCRTECQFVHYDNLPKNLSTAIVLSAVEKIVTKLGLAENQM